jgi:hypothetical protein
MSAQNIEALIEAAKLPNSEEQERLVRALTRNSNGSSRQRGITKLRGLGKEIWQRVDAQNYINAGRDSWTN